MWWIFNVLAAANGAQNAAFAQLPPDTLIDGRTAPVQYTKRWDNVASLTDGTFAFRLKPGMATPGAVAATKTDAQVGPLLPAVAQGQVQSQGKGL